MTTILSRFGDRDRFDEFMRQIQLLAEPGESLPADLLLQWNEALITLDPIAAREQAFRLLSDLNAAQPEDSSNVLQAAHQLLQATLAVGDHETADNLANHWAPIALNAAHSAGAKRWWDIIEVDLEDDKP
jgi:hypothetical protein